LKYSHVAYLLAGKGYFKEIINHEKREYSKQATQQSSDIATNETV
jgi:hypothetical protein